MTSTRETSDSDACSRAVELWRPRVLDYLENHTRELVNQLSELVREPSISGSDEENSIQHRLAGELNALGLDVDHWQIPLEERCPRRTFLASKSSDGKRGASSAEPPAAATALRSC